VKIRRPALWIAITYIAVEFALVAFLPENLSWVGVLWVVLAELAASYACFNAVRIAQHEGRILWRLMALSLMLAPLSAFLLIWLELHGSGQAGLFSGLIMLLNALYGAALLLTVTLQFDPRVLRPLREMSAFLSVAIAGLCFVLVVSVVPMRGGTTPGDLDFVTHLFNATGLFISAIATIRMIGTDRQEERSFFFVASVFLWANTAILAIRNHFVLNYNMRWFDLLIPVPYVLLAVMAGRVTPRWIEEWQPSPRVSSIVRSGGTALLSFGLLVLGTAVSRRHFWLGASAALLSVICYSALNLIALSRGIEAEEALLAAKQKLEELAGLDGLTGISNRRTLDQRLEFELQAARRSGQPISLLMIDVDLFKSLNDSKGHLVGDSYLVQVANALRGALSRTNDLVARYGGEEFVVLLPTTGDAGAMTIAGRLHNAISKLGLEHPSSPSGRLTISIGCTTAEAIAHHSPVALLDAADRAMYLAKSHGRNRTEFLPCGSPVVDVKNAS
jgi:diguanylate cyclase (GGDEF)-like protein